MPDVTSMRVAVVTAPGQAALRQLDRPEPGPGEVRVRLEGCGICGSNLPVWEGRPWFTYPLDPGAPGHEGWGVVDALAPDVTALRPGQRVALLSGHAFAEYDVAPAGSVVALPPALDGMPFPGEPLGCGMNVFRRSDIRSGQSIAVIGVGFLGAVVVALAARAGARVAAVARRRSALDLAERLGASAVFRMEDVGQAASEVMSWTRGEGCDRVIEAAGVQPTLDVASELVRTRGRLVIAGYHQDGLRQVNMQSWNWRGIDVINAHEREPAAYVQGIRDAVDAVVSGALDPRPLFTDTFPLQELGAGLRALAARPDGFVKALVLT